MTSTTPMTSSSSTATSATTTITGRSTGNGNEENRRKKQVQVMRQKAKARQEAVHRARQRQIVTTTERPLLSDEQQQQSEATGTSAAATTTHAAVSANSPLPKNSTPSSSSPGIVMTSTPRRSTAYVSLRRREIIEKRRHSLKGSTTASPPVVGNSSSDGSSDGRNHATSIDENPAAVSTKRGQAVAAVQPGSPNTTTKEKEEEQPTDPTDKEEEESPAAEENTVSSSMPTTASETIAVDEKTTSSSNNACPVAATTTMTTEDDDDDDRNDNHSIVNHTHKKEDDPKLMSSTRTMTTSWDTRSIHDVPLEPAFDPAWDATNDNPTLLFEQQSTASAQAAAAAAHGAANIDMLDTMPTHPINDKPTAEAAAAVATLSNTNDTAVANSEEEFHVFDSNSWEAAAAAAVPTTTASSSSSPSSCSTNVPTNADNDKDMNSSFKTPLAAAGQTYAETGTNDDNAVSTKQVTVVNNCPTDEEQVVAATGDTSADVSGSSDISKKASEKPLVEDIDDSDNSNAVTSKNVVTQHETIDVKVKSSSSLSTTSHLETISSVQPNTASPGKEVNVSLDVQLGASSDGVMATHVDRFLNVAIDSNSSGDVDKDDNVRQHNEDEVVTKQGTEDGDSGSTDAIDFSATAFENLKILKDDEALLGSDQVRSDVADGVLLEGESDAYDAVRLMKQLDKQTRIEQYTEERADDDSSKSEDKEEQSQDDEVDDDDFQDDQEEIQYISADSSEEEELVKHVRPAPPVPEVISSRSAEGATFAAAASATLGDRGIGNRVSPTPISARKDGSGMRRENLEAIDAHSSSSGSAKGDSTAVASSVASSSLLGAGLFSAGASVNTELTAGSSVVSSNGHAVTRGASPIDKEALKPPPPPPPSQPKRKSTKSSSKATKPLLKIPPPPPEKIQKWEEQKMRPFKHLQAVAEAKANSDSSPQPTETSASEYVSLSLITSVSSSHSHDEVETTLGKSIADEHNSALSSLGHEGKADAKQVDSNEAERSARLDESQMTQKSQEVSFPDARSVGATSTSASMLVLSPPLVSRTKLDEAVGLAPGEDGVWKEDSIRKSPHSVKKTISPLSDTRMAERFTLASSTAARKFEEKYPDVDEEAKVAKASATQPQKLNAPIEETPIQQERSETSFFCAPDMLGGTSFCQPASSDALDDNDDGNLLSHLSTHAKSWASSMDGKGSIADNVADSRQRAVLDSSFDDTHHAGLELVGGAFSTWKNSDYAYGSDVGVKDPREARDSLSKTIEAATDDVFVEELRLLSWLENDVLARASPPEVEKTSAQSARCRARFLSLLKDDTNFNRLCRYASENVVPLKSFDDSSTPSENGPKERIGDRQGPLTVHRFSIPAADGKRISSSVLAANFISFLNRISLLSGVESPFKDENPFLMDVVSTSLILAGKGESETNATVEEERTLQELIFEHELGEVVGMVRFFYRACGPRVPKEPGEKDIYFKAVKPTDVVREVDAASDPFAGMDLLYRVPTQSPSPFETASWNLPSIVAIVLGFLGDPVAVCRMKMINHFYNRLIQENEHVIMRDAVRLGGISIHIRPAFWMWITLEKCGRAATGTRNPREGDERAQADGQDPEASDSRPQCITTVLPQLEKQGREGKWHHVIERDVTRAFGNMPPHKTGARLRTDSIVRALVTWGRGRVLSRGVKGGGVSPPTPVIPPPGIEKAKQKPRPATGPPPWETADVLPEKEDGSGGPPDTVSQWSGISPVPSYCSNSGISDKDSGSFAGRANITNGVTKALEKYPSNRMKNSRAIEELALSGNTLTAEMKEGLQNQLGYILHALAAAHEDVGYCQGMDYVVAHLLRVLQDTVRWHSVRGTLSPVIKAQPAIPTAESDERSLTKEIDQAIDSSLVVEETVFRVMDTFLTTYNLRHMYWPELRCLKTCCRVFERLIQLKLPVLADHFAYHDLNVGLFALGWFQTLFLYLPSMPSATVCHMWDIWLVERSFKIFFRVGTAILFLSQPILLNHELEGMMTYLNTFPDATLLNPDILIACALQIKVTNRMLEEIERDLTGGY